MDVVLIFNGLGNQMSQYAFYLAKKRKYKHTHCIYYPDKYIKQHNGYELDKLFGIKIENHTNFLLCKLLSLYHWSQVCDSRKRHWLRVILKHLRVCLIRENGYAKNTKMFNSQNEGIRFLYGGWHCEDYFIDAEDDIRKLYTFNEKQLDSENDKVLKKIRNSVSVSIHIRRGDFLNDVYDGICTKEYYEKAIKFINEHIECPHFFVFSDDIDWAKGNIKTPNVTFIDSNHGKDSWKDMMLMSNCKHNINANSTFSWWGAWLNSNVNKIVLVPNKFTQLEPTDSIYPKNWIRIS